MTKAEEKALEAYPVEIVGYTVECRIGAEPEPLDWTKKFRKCFAEGYEQAEKDLSPKWHKSTEHPKPDTEVLAEVKGFEHNRFAVLKWTKEGWWQHIPRMNDIMPSDGWIGTQGLFVIRWAYIEDRPQE